MTAAGVVALIAALTREGERLEQMHTKATERRDAPGSVLSLLRSAREDLREAELHLTTLVKVRS